MLPPIDRGGAPETAEVILNCQFPSTFGADDGGGEVTPPAAPGAPPVVPWYPAPPHPPRRTSNDSPKMFAQRVMDVSPGTVLQLLHAGSVPEEVYLRTELCGWQLFDSRSVWVRTNKSRFKEDSSPQTQLLTGLSVGIGLCSRRNSEFRAVTAGGNAPPDIEMWAWPFLLTLWQTPGKQHSAPAGQNVLPVIQFKGDRRTRDLAAGASIPERFAIITIEGKNIAAGVAGEGDA